MAKALMAGDLAVASYQPDRAWDFLAIQYPCSIQSTRSRRSAENPTDSGLAAILGAAVAMAARTDTASATEIVIWLNRRDMTCSLLENGPNA